VTLQGEGFAQVASDLDLEHVLLVWALALSSSQLGEMVGSGLLVGNGSWAELNTQRCNIHLA
jgi:hypothetical protein